MQAVLLSGVDQDLERDRTAELGVHELGRDANRIVLGKPADRVVAEGEPRDSHDREEQDGGHAREHRLRMPDALVARPQQHALDPAGSPGFARSEALERNRVEQGREQHHAVGEPQSDAERREDPQVRDGLYLCGEKGDQAARRGECGHDDGQSRVVQGVGEGLFARLAGVVGAEEDHQQVDASAHADGQQEGRQDLRRDSEAAFRAAPWFRRSRRSRATRPPAGGIRRTRGGTTRTGTRPPRSATGT